jgi:hypothetical protein
VLILIAATALAATQPMTHSTVVEHEGTAYTVSYRPQIATTMRTIGMSVGSRPSSERCLWSATVSLDREIKRGNGGEPLLKRVPGEGHRIEGQTPGKCAQGRTLIDRSIAARVADAQERLVALAEADRASALADIGAAHDLALN